MSPDTYFLITLLQDNSYYGKNLIKCAVAMDSTGMSKDLKCNYNEPENRKLLRRALPEHARSIGPIVDVEPIFSINIVVK